MYSTNLNDLLSDGFSRKFATYYLDLAKKEKSNPAYDSEYVEWAHANGFLAESAYAYSLNDDNCNNYLKDYDYYKVWPLNSWTRIWINDKLTLKYMLAKTELDSFMPKYYYYTSPVGLRSLIDHPRIDEAQTAENFVKLLSEVKTLACKPCNGTTSLGFIKMTIENGKIYANDEEIHANEMGDFLNEHINYVFTEFIEPGGVFKKMCPNIHTLRLVVLNSSGNNPEIVGGYLRIPNNESGAANYVILNGENADKFNLFLDIDVESGHYGNAKLIYVDRVVDTDVHPDTGIKLDGYIEKYDELKKTVLDIAKTFNTIEYMGFDIGITENGFKCMEINSHPGIKYMQIFHSLVSDSDTKDYFEKKISEVNKLNNEQKAARNNIVR